MPFYRLKTPHVAVQQLTKDADLAWIGQWVGAVIKPFPLEGKETVLCLEFAEATLYADYGDYLLMHQNGLIEIVPFKDFKSKYEPVTS